MPTLVRTPFNQGGSYQADPFDSEDQGNRSAAMQMLQMNMGAAQNNALTQLALARLKSDDYHYSQDRTDRMGSQQALFNYMGNRDKIGDTHWEQQFGYQTDPTKNPFMQSGIDVNNASGALAKFRLEQEKANAQRSQDAGNATPDLTNATPTDRAAYQAAIAGNESPAQAGAEQKAREFQRAQGEVKTTEDAIGGDLDTFSNRDNAMVGWDPTQADSTGLANRLAKLEETLRIKLGKSDAEAREEANNLVRQHTKHSLNSGAVDSLRQLRNIPY